MAPGNPTGAPAAVHTQAFLEALFGNVPGSLYLGIVTLPSARHVWFRASDLAGITASAQQDGPCTDVYVTCALHRLPGPRGTNLGGIPGLWGDIDVIKVGNRHRYFPDRAGAQAFLLGLAIPPTLLIWSGGGFHAWWCFREPWLFDDDGATALALVRRFQRYLQQRARSHGVQIDSTFDGARFLRIPGTVNHKYGCPVVLQAADGPRVDPSEVEDLLVDGVDAEPIAVGMGVAALALDPNAMPPRAQFAELCRQSPTFAKLWCRELSPMDASQSGFDFRLAMLATGAGWSDADIVALLIAHRRRGGGPPKLRWDYFVRTLSRVRRTIALRSANSIVAVRLFEPPAAVEVYDHET